MALGASKMNYKKRKSTDHIVVYCSQTGTQDLGKDELDRKYRAQGKFDVGYHFIIRRDGSVEYCRSVEVVGSHSPDLDDTSIAICLIGGDEADDVIKAEHKFIPEQFFELDFLIVELKDRYPNAKLVGY